MKFYFNLALFLMVIQLSGYSQKESGRKYKIKSGIIVYELKGITSGKETLYFDDYGQKEATYTESETKLMGTSTKTNQLTITDEEWVYVIDLDNETGTRTKNQSITKYDNPEQILLDMGGKKIGNEKLLGKECEVWEFKKMATKTWIWNGLSLKNVISISDFSLESTAIKIEEDVAVAPKFFKIPIDVKITDSKVLHENKQ